VGAIPVAFHHDVEELVREVGVPRGPRPGELEAVVAYRQLDERFPRQAVPFSVHDFVAEEARLIAHAAPRRVVSSGGNMGDAWNGPVLNMVVGATNRLAIGMSRAAAAAAPTDEQAIRCLGATAGDDGFIRGGLVGVGTAIYLRECAGVFLNVKKSAITPWREGATAVLAENYLRQTATDLVVVDALPENTTGVAIARALSGEEYSDLAWVEAPAVMHAATRMTQPDHKLLLTTRVGRSSELRVGAALPDWIVEDGDGVEIDMSPHELALTELPSQLGKASGSERRLGPLLAAAVARRGVELKHTEDVLVCELTPATVRQLASFGVDSTVIIPYHAPVRKLRLREDVPPVVLRHWFAANLAVGQARVELVRTAIEETQAWADENPAPRGLTETAVASPKAGRARTAHLLRT
jgi:hypothetical protein